MMRTRGVAAAQARAVYLDEDEAAFASVARSYEQGLAIADLALVHGRRLFRERRIAVCDALAERWWHAEHDGATLPRSERADVRARIGRLLATRVPETLGDQAALDGEMEALLELPAEALRSASAEIEERTAGAYHRLTVGSACVMHALFAVDRVSFAHVGECRVLRRRQGAVTALTLEPPRGAPDAGIAGVAGVAGAADIFGRAPDRLVARVEVGDVFLLMTRGVHELWPSPELEPALLERGVEVVPHLVARGLWEGTEDRGAVAVEILEVAC